MAERLHAINVGYRPLNPADDVAGLAGQKQAVTEFEAKSTDMARRAAAQNASAALALKVQQVAQQAQQAAVTASNNMRKARMQIGMQQAELAHRVLASNAQLDMQQRMMPLEMDRMAIENDYALAKGGADISAIESQNAVRGAQLRQYAEEEQDIAALNGLEEDVAAHISKGGTVDSYKGKHAALKTVRGQQAKKLILDQFKVSTGATARSRTVQAQAVRASTLTQGQLDIFNNTRHDYMSAHGGGLMKGGGALVYRNSDDSLNDLGRELEGRMLRTNDVGLTLTEIAELKSVSSELYQNIDGNIILTNEGIVEFQGRRIGRDPKMFLDSVTDTDGKKVAVYKSVNQKSKEVLGKWMAHHAPPRDEDTGIRPPMSDESFDLAHLDMVREVGFDVLKNSKGTIDRMKAQGWPIYESLPGGGIQLKMGSDLDAHYAGEAAEGEAAEGEDAGVDDAGKDGPRKIWDSPGAPSFQQKVEKAQKAKAKEAGVKVVEIPFAGGDKEAIVGAVRKKYQWQGKRNPRDVGTIDPKDPIKLVEKRIDAAKETLKKRDKSIAYLKSRIDGGKDKGRALMTSKTKLSRYTREAKAIKGSLPEWESDLAKLYKSAGKKQPTSEEIKAKEKAEARRKFGNLVEGLAAALETEPRKPAGISPSPRIKPPSAPVTVDDRREAAKLQLQKAQYDYGRMKVGKDGVTKSSKEKQAKLIESLQKKHDSIK